MRSVEFKCPHCGETLEATDDMRGQQVECPSCGKPLKIPDPTSAGAAGDSMCLNCGAAMESDALLCVKCGYHTKLGKVIETNLS